MEPVPPVTAEERDWAELPWDALSVIFDKIGAVAVLFAAQAVCRPWRKLALEPRMWRIIDMRFGFYDYVEELYVEKMALAAVDRSAGHLLEFYIRNDGTDAVLKHIAERSAELKCLHLIYCTEMSNRGLIEACKSFALLEELQITHFLLREEAFESIGRSCPNLKRFRLNCVGVNYHPSECNKEAIAIAKSLPGLRELELFGNRLDNDGLRAILDGCPLLESLDIRGCFHINFDEALKHRCKGLKTLKLPRDPTDDYYYETYVTRYFGPEYESDNYFDEFYPDYDDYDFTDPEQYDDFTRVPDLFGFDDLEQYDEARVPDLSAINLMFSDMFFVQEFLGEHDDF